MKKDTIIRVASIVGVFGILYFIYKKMVKQNNVGGFGGVDDGVKIDPKTPTPTDSTYEKYIVNTQSDPLRIRETPSQNAKVSGKLNKGQEVLLKPSSTQGWMEYSTNGTTTFGYVSSQYVTKKESTSNFVGEPTFVDDRLAIFEDDGRAIVNKPSRGLVNKPSRGIVNRSDKGDGRALVN
jgi:hypothetical protein